MPATCLLVPLLFAITPLPPFPFLCTPYYQPHISPQPKPTDKRSSSLDEAMPPSAQPTQANASANETFCSLPAMHSPVSTPFLDKALQCTLCLCNAQVQLSQSLGLYYSKRCFFHLQNKIHYSLCVTLADRSSTYLGWRDKCSRTYLSLSTQSTALLLLLCLESMDGVTFFVGISLFVQSSHCRKCLGVKCKRLQMFGIAMLIAGRPLEAWHKMRCLDCITLESTLCFAPLC